jgi:tetratricopeptide (TPR) repeat protein
MTLIRGGWVIFVFQFLTAPWLVAQDAGPVRAVEKLEPHRVIERELGPGQTGEYTLDVKAGQFVRLVARQMGVDVAVTVLDPLAKTLLQADRPNGAFGPEAASFIGEISGEYRVRVSSGSTSTGRYRMELLELREPTEADRSRIEAERLEFQGTREARLRSIELFERARSIWHRLGDAYEEGLCLNAVGTHYSDLGEKQKALDYYGLALPIRRTVGDRSGEAATLNNLGSVYDNLGDKPKALDYYGQALPLFRAVGNRSGEATILTNIGSVDSDLGETPKALEYYDQALTIRRAVGDRSGEAATLDNIGRVYSDLGEEQKALGYFGQALPLYRAVGNRYGEAAALNNIGYVYFDLGEKQKALDHLGQALPLYRAVGDRSGETSALTGIGSVYSDLGEKQKALDYYGLAWIPTDLRHPSQRSL